MAKLIIILKQLLDIVSGIHRSKVKDEKEDISFWVERYKYHYNNNSRYIVQSAHDDLEQFKKFKREYKDEYQ